MENCADEELEFVYRCQLCQERAFRRPHHLMKYWLITFIVHTTLLIVVLSVVTHFRKGISDHDIELHTFLCEQTKSELGKSIKTNHHSCSSCSSSLQDRICLSQRLGPRVVLWRTELRVRFCLGESYFSWAFLLEIAFIRYGFYWLGLSEVTSSAPIRSCRLKSHR